MLSFKQFVKESSDMEYGHNSYESKKIRKQVSQSAGMKSSRGEYGRGSYFFARSHIEREGSHRDLNKFHKSMKDSGWSHVRTKPLSREYRKQGKTHDHHVGVSHDNNKKILSIDMHHSQKR